MELEEEENPTTTTGVLVTDDVDLNNTATTTTVAPLHKELYFLIAKFLSTGPCKGATEALIEEIERHEIIPKSVNWLGVPISQDYRTFSSKFDHISPDHLPKLLDQLVKTVNAKEQSSNNVASRSLLSFSTSLINKRIGDGTTPPGSSKSSSWSKKSGYNVLLRSLDKEKRVMHPVHAISDRPLMGTGVNHSLIHPEFYKRMHISFCTLGHLAAVYCVSFDVSGRYIFTGADDNLIKIWSALDGRLVTTLRGTAGEIVDLTINQENTLLAVASVEKVIRVWCLQTGAPLTTLTGQGGNITSIYFCPMPRSRSNVRYLTSTSTDGSCAFWAYTDEPGDPVQFQQKPTLYLERMRPGNAKMICSAFSSGGLFMAAGSADNHVRVYYMLGTEGPERILEVEHHSDRVDSISWAHKGLRFVSGSKDGTALIWRFENACWRYIRLHCSKTQGQATVVYDDPKRRPRVTMVGWNRDDSLVLTAVSDFITRVWNSKTGELVRVLKEHSSEAYVIEPHPVNPRIVCTAGHDGKLIVWDIGTTNRNDQYGKIYEYHNILEGQGHGAVFDCKWSPDGFSLVATDSHGHLMILTVEAEHNDRLKKIPAEMFFHTDYRPINRDAITGEIVDEQTQIAPHLMPPPFLVDMEGNPYSSELQRLVPGRENMRDEYLIPQVAVSDRGFQEVIEGIPARSNIDQMIQQLARAQGLGEQAEADNNNPNGGERRGVGQRRSGEIEGVRQSRGNWQTDCYGFTKKNHIVPPMSKSILEFSESRRAGLLEDEENWYIEHLVKCPVSGTVVGVPAAMGSPAESPEGRSRRIRRLAAQAAERRQLHNDEEESFAQVEGVARPNPRPQQEISVSQARPRAGGSRQVARPNGATFRPPRRVRVGAVNIVNNNNNVPNPNRRPRPVRYDVRRILGAHGSDIENIDLEDSSSEASVEDSSSSDSDDSSESDWGGNLGASQRRRDCEQAANRRSAADGGGRTRTTRTQSNTSPDEQEESEPDVKPNTSEIRAGPSSEITMSIKSEGHKQTRPRKTKSKVDYSGGLEEVAPEFRPSDWLSEVFPQRSPYFPQLGDDMVYFRQGHESYIQYVETNKLYQIPKKMMKSLPYVIKPDLEPEVSVRVVGIKFELEPPRVAILKLARTNWETGELRNEYLYVKYHDVANVVDFLILRHMYDKSTRRKWNEGDRFRCLIGREWWLGTVIKSEPHSKEYPQSNYLCYKAKWDNGDPETMSPWDLITVPDDFVIPEDEKDGIVASDEDLRFGLYEPVATDWPPLGHQDAQCQKLSTLLEQVMALAVSEAFLTPVDLNQYPDYAYAIEYPIDLSTIKTRLDNRFYRRIDALKFDFTYIAMNAEKYNQTGSEIVKHARVVRDVCLEILTNPDVTCINPIYHRISKNQEPTEAKKQTKSTSKSSSSKVGSSSSQPHCSKSLRTRPRDRDEDMDREDTRDWREQCLELLDDLYHKKDAAPFREPVDIIEYPEYYQQIDTPVYLGSIREDLQGRNYDSLQAFHKDMMLIFTNSKQFNTERSAIYAMTCRLEGLYGCLIKPILSKRRTKIRKAQKASTPTKKGRGQPTNSATSTPRKNPRRSTAGKHNNYAHHSEDSDDDQEQRNPSRDLRTRNKKSIRASLQNGDHSRSRRVNGQSSPSATTTPSRNGTGSSRNSTESSGASGSQPRRVKRLRISSGESEQTSPQRETKHKVTTAESPLRASPRKHKIQIKDEPESDEYEDSHDDGVDMPTLNKANDGDYNLSENDSEDGMELNIRRSTRAKIKRRNGASDDFGYETRNKGKPPKSYAESQEASDDDDGHFKRRRINGTSPIRNTRSHPPLSQPPVLRRTISEESDDQEEEDINRPGPSSRLMRTPKTPTQSPQKSKGKGTPSPIRNALEDPEDEEEDEESEEKGSESEDEENSDDSDDEDDTSSRTKKASRGPQRQQRRPLRQRQNVSDDDEFEVVSRKSKSSSSSLRRPTRGTTVHRPDYAEESDSEPHISDIGVSSRGRVLKRKRLERD